MGLRVSPPGVEWLDAVRVRHGGEHIAHVGNLIKRAAEPQHFLGRTLVQRASRTVAELGLDRALRQRMVAITAERTIYEMLVRLARRGRDPHACVEVILGRATEA